MNTTEATPKCFVCGSDMWLEVKDHSWGQSQVWRCRAPASHNVLQAIPKKWWGTTIQYIRQRGWTHDIERLVERAQQQHQALHAEAT